MNPPLRWSMLIQWSDEDDAFLVTLPEWEGRVINPVTHGGTYEDAVRNGREVLEMLAELSIEQGRPLTEPKLAVVAA
jgi:antitoxin HicB